jgi:hypothetical protein
MSRLDEALARLERAVARLEAAFAGMAGEEKGMLRKAELDRANPQLGAVFGESSVARDGRRTRSERVPKEEGDE